MKKASLFDGEAFSVNYLVTQNVNLTLAQ